MKHPNPIKSSVIIILIVSLSFTFFSPFLYSRVESKEVERSLKGGEIEKHLEELEQLIAEGNLGGLKGKAEVIQKDYGRMMGEIGITKAKLISKNIDSVISKRIERCQNKLQRELGLLVRRLGVAKTIEDYQKLQPLINILRNKNQQASEIKISTPASFKVKSQGEIIAKKIGNKDLKIAQANPSFSGLLEPDTYLKEEGEIVFSKSIKSLADTLEHDPLKILNYAKNNIEYVPYYGFKKGADATLIERAGNDIDQASLLIALLRFSGYPTRYVRGQVKMSINQIINLLGVEDPRVAARILHQARIPYILYTDFENQPLFFVLEYTWVESYITYDYTRGIRQSTNETEKMWIPMAPGLKFVSYSQFFNIPDEMKFDVQLFYEQYLQGSFGQEKPITAFRQKIIDYLATNHPDLSYEDVLTQYYQQNENLEFIPNTLPFEIVERIGDYNRIPEVFFHKLQLVITEALSKREVFNAAIPVYAFGQKQLVLTFVAATPVDQEVMNQYQTIYDIVPLSIVHVKPVLKVNGEIKYGGGSGAPQVMLGSKHKLTVRFLVPNQEDNQVRTVEEDVFEKEAVAGNEEGIAINTDRIVLPETRPREDTQTREFLSAQKLHTTSLHYLDWLQQSHDELGKILGGSFNIGAAGAIVFNGIEVNYQAGEPYSFVWKGLRIESSSKVYYFSRFGNDIKRNFQRFTHLFGLEGSLQESSIFEEDFTIESMSTVKGLRLINEGKIPGVNMVKITRENISLVDTLELSSETRNKFRAAIDVGHIIYTATKPFTYHNWSGLVYIDLDPETGSGSYLIGEGLNGGYTAGNWPEEKIKFWLFKGDIQDLKATIFFPSQDNQEFKQGDKIEYSINYEGTVYFIYPVFWNERGLLNTSEPGTKLLLAQYGAGGDNVRRYGVRGKKKLGSVRNQYDAIIFEEAERFSIDPDLLKSLIHQESLNEHYQFHKDAYRYEPCIDYNWFSGNNPSIGLTSEPYSHYAIQGKGLRGNTIPEGDKVATLDPPYKQMVKNGVLVSKWALRFDDNDTDLTLTELWQNNNDIQNWDRTCSLTPEQRSFTVQFLLSGSYGLAQVLYQTAIESGFNSEKLNRSPYDLFRPEIGIHYGAKRLRQCFDKHGNWRTAVRCYNGDPTRPPTEEYAKQVYDRYYLSNLYDLITEE